MHVKKPTGNGNSIAHTNNEGKGGVQVKEETGINHNTNKNTELIIIQIRIHIRSIHVCPELEEMVFLLPNPPCLCVKATMSGTKSRIKKIHREETKTKRVIWISGCSSYKHLVYGEMKMYGMQVKK